MLTKPCSGDDSWGDTASNMLAAGELRSLLENGTNSNSAELPCPSPYSARGLLDCSTCTQHG